MSVSRQPHSNIAVVATPLGNIETGFQLFKTPKTCITKSCVSSADSKIPKELVDEIVER